MNLSSLYNNAPEYIEFGWVTAPNAAGQSISANTITTLTLDTEVADTGGLVSAPSSNQFTLPAGTFYYEASTSCNAYDPGSASATLALYNVTDTAYVSRTSLKITDSRHSGGLQVSRISGVLNGQFVIAANKTFDLRLLSGDSMTVNNGTQGSALSTNSTAGADQRTTIKLWKLK